MNPLGLDAPAPRLSWELHSDKRGVTQASYRVLVASTAELLARNQGDIWDSGAVGSLTPTPPARG